MKIEINPKYQSLKDYLLTLPSLMSSTEGETIHNGRNLIKVFTAPDGTRLNVKRYHRPILINAIVYTLGIRKPKGKRAFDYPRLLLDAGINTPEPVAYIEQHTCGLIAYSYFVSIQCNLPNRFYEVPNDPAEIYVPLAEAFARLTAQMHNARMLHRDYSPGNILWQCQSDGHFDFSLVDINRMYFGDVSLEMGCANFARLWGSKHFFSVIADVYAKERGFDAQKCLECVLRERRAFWSKYLKHHTVPFTLDF